MNFLEKIKKIFKNKNKSYYIQNVPDWGSWGYWIFIISLFIYFIVRSFSNPRFATPFLFMIPAIIGIFVIFFFVPVRILTFWITELVLFLHLRNVSKSKVESTVIIIGKNEYLKPSFWLNPNYDIDLLFIKKYLRMKKEMFSVFKDVSLTQLDEIMKNKNIRIIYLVGHGRRHGFVLNTKTVVDYCRYNNKKFEKEFVYQIHCNQWGGKSLVEYVVTKENRDICKPDHGYMSTTTINQMFIDKIIQLGNYGKYKAFFLRVAYNLLTITIPLTVFILWGYIFVRLIM